MFDKRTDHGNDVMVTQFGFLLLAHAIFRENSSEIDIKTVNVMVKYKSTTFVMDCTLIDQRNDVKLFKTLQ